MTQELFDEHLTNYCNSEMLGHYPEALIEFVDSMSLFLSGERPMEESLEELNEKYKDVSVTQEVLRELYVETLISAFSNFPFPAQIPMVDEFHTDFQEQTGKYTHGVGTFVDHLQNSDIFKDVIFGIVGRESYER